MLARTTRGSLTLRSILVASDFSTASEKALRHALTIARSFDAELHLVHVVPPPQGSTLAGPDENGHAITRSLEIASGIERKLLCSGAIRGLRFRSMVRAGDIWSELLKVIQQEFIDLVVVGTHPRKGIRKPALGSVAEQIFRQAPRPVLTIGPGAPPDAHLKPGTAPRPLLFVTDFSETSVAAFPLAVAVANRRQSQLVLAHIHPPEALRPEVSLMPEESAVPTGTEVQAAAIRRLQQLAEPAELIAEPAFIAECGDPAEGILRVAAEVNAEAIVMGLRRRRFPETRSHVPWSTAYEVVCRARCAVLTVRGYSL